MEKKRKVLYAVLIIAGVSIFMLILYISEKSPSFNQFDQQLHAKRIQPPDKTTVHLYFVDKKNTFLMAEEKTLFHPDDPVEFGSIIIDALIKGPQKELMRTIPANTKLRALFITQNGTAYVDLTENVTAEHPGGSKSEIITIYSIANSLILNIDEINTVKILINGREADTLAGHIDLSSPFKANMLLVR